jgi:hypothetical protein
MDSFYRLIFYPIAFILSLFSTKYITSCLRSRVDMLNSVFMIFNLSLITTLPHQQNA